MTTSRDNCLKKQYSVYIAFERRSFGRHVIRKKGTGYRGRSCYIGHFFFCNRDFVAAASIMQIESTLFSTTLSRHLSMGTIAKQFLTLHVASRSLAKFSAGFPPKMIPATYRIRQEPRGNGCSGKVREMACRVIRGRGGGACQLFPCCHLQWPVQSEGGTDLRVSRIIITQAERHAARRFMGHIMARHLNDYLLLNVNGL